MFPKRRISHVQGYLELGMLAEAAAELDRIAAPDSESTEVLRLRVELLHEQKNWGELCAIAQKLTRRTPTEAAAWVTWAYATRRADTLEAAEKILLEAEHYHPTDPTIQFNLGCYACQRGDLVLARRRVDQAIALDRKFVAMAATDPDLEPLRTTDCQPGA